MKKIILIAISIIAAISLLFNIILTSKFNKLNKDIDNLQNEIYDLKSTNKDLKLQNKILVKQNETFANATDTNNISYLEDITLENLKSKIDNKESFILAIVSKYCSHCTEYKPKLEKILKAYNIVAYEIDISTLTASEKEEFNNIIKFRGTPTTLFFEEGKELSETSRITGNASEEVIISKLQKNGYKKIS